MHVSLHVQDAISYHVEGRCFTGRVQIKWIGQLVKRPYLFVLHSDGKHKLHHGGWLLISIGTHHIRCVYPVSILARIPLIVSVPYPCRTLFPCVVSSSSHSKSPQELKYYTSFIPLVYLFCKQQETDGACLMMMEALNLISVKYYKKPLQPGACCSDHSDAFRKAYNVRILRYSNLYSPPFYLYLLCIYLRIPYVSVQKTWPDAVFIQCWPHIARKVAEGEYWKTTWEHHADAGEHIRAIHMSQTLEMKDMLIEQAGLIWDSWGGRTTVKFWNSHCVAPWDNWTMASCIDVPLCTPSQNTQESWHNNLLHGKIPQMFGGSTEHVLAVAMPQLVKMDGYLLPDELSFDVIERSYSNAYSTSISLISSPYLSAYPISYPTHFFTVSVCRAPCQVPLMHDRWMTKALWYIENEKTNVRIRQYPDDKGWYFIVLRKDQRAKSLTSTLVRDIELVLAGIPIVAACVSLSYPLSVCRIPLVSLT